MSFALYSELQQPPSFECMIKLTWMCKILFLKTWADMEVSHYRLWLWNSGHIYIALGIIFARIATIDTETNGLLTVPLDLSLVKLIEAETKWPPFSRRHFPVFFLNENVWISMNISLKFVPKGPINDMPALVHIMAWRRAGDKPLSEPTMVSLLTHICVTRPQWVNICSNMSNEMLYGPCMIVPHKWTKICWLATAN